MAKKEHMASYIAAIKFGNRCELTTDQDAVLKADQSDIIYVTDIESLFEELARRYPAPDPRLTKLDSYGDFGVTINDAAKYKGTSLREAKELAKLYGAVTIGDYEVVEKHFGYYANDRTKCDKLLPQGYIFRHDGHVLSYDPAGAQKRLKAKAKALELKDKNQLTVKEIDEIPRAINTQLEGMELARIPFPPVWMVDGGGSSRAARLRHLASMCRMFDVVFGINAHRKLPVFQTFITAWKTRGKKTRQVIDGSKKMGKAAIKVCNWLDKETKAKLPKPLKTFTATIPGIPVFSLNY